MIRRPRRAQGYIEQMIGTKFSSILRYENPQMPLVYAMYEIIRDFLRNVVIPKASVHVRVRG